MKMLNGLLCVLVLLTLAGCDINILDRSRGDNITIVTQLVTDTNDDTWLVDQEGTVLDGPLSVQPMPGPRVPPPTLIPGDPPTTAIPGFPVHSGFPWFLLLLVGVKGCVAIGDNARVQMFERGEVQPSLALSVGSRTQATAAAAQRDADSGNESLTEGGGAVSVKE